MGLELHAEVFNLSNPFNLSPPPLPRPTDDVEPGRRGEPPPGHVLRHAGEVGAVSLPGLDDDEVSVVVLEVVRVATRLHLHAVLQPVDLETGTGVRLKDNGSEDGKSRCKGALVQTDSFVWRCVL